MKTLLFAIAIFSLASCSSSKKEETSTPPAETANYSYFGDSISVDNAIEAGDVLAQLTGKDSAALKVNGVIEEVCQKKGCWMIMKLDSNTQMRISFKDYGFFVPKNSAGNTAIIEGYAYKDTTSVEELRHFATDAGKSKEEIEKITTPEINISFEASGVVIKK